MFHYPHSRPLEPASDKLFFFNFNSPGAALVDEGELGFPG